MDFPTSEPVLIDLQRANEGAFDLSDATEKDDSFVPVEELELVLAVQEGYCFGLEGLAHANIRPGKLTS